MKDENGDGRIDLADVEWLIKNDRNVLTRLEGDGDFRSAECIALLKEADIVVTNPPFSLFREYVAQLVLYGKKFLIIGNLNAMHYKEVFPLFMNDKMWLGVSIHSGDRKFTVPENYPLDAAGCGVDDNGQRFIRVKGVRWFTNLDYKQRHEEFVFVRHYNPIDYPKYKNYDAIEVAKTADIPEDWDGLMGVPDTFLDRYNPDQFEIVGNAGDTSWARSAGVQAMGAETIARLRKQGNKAHVTANMNSLYLDHDGKILLPYSRIIIRRKK